MDGADGAPGRRETTMAKRSKIPAYEIGAAVEFSGMSEAGAPRFGTRGKVIGREWRFGRRAPLYLTLRVAVADANGAVIEIDSRNVRAA